MYKWCIANVSGCRKKCGPRKLWSWGIEKETFAVGSATKSQLIVNLFSKWPKISRSKVFSVKIFLRRERRKIGRWRRKGGGEDRSYSTHFCLRKSVKNHVGPTAMMRAKNIFSTFLLYIIPSYRPCSRQWICGFWHDVSCNLGGGVINWSKVLMNS